MKAEDLRIGNYVGLYGSIATIQRADFDTSKTAIAVDEGKPIPLTEEWLAKFGFKKYPGRLNKFDRDDFWTCDLMNGNEWCFKDIECCIKYVHQLQNLFWVLTGKELTIK
ncbi:MAG: hypothetical protein ACXAC7_23250 [Candidatus Hodarchaeales archaeon]|jgi:hypothetical protein